MNAFRYGPFEFDRTKSIKVNGVASYQWVLAYDGRELAMKTLPSTHTSHQIVDAFGGVIGSWYQSARNGNKPDVLKLVQESTGDAVASLPVASWPALTPGLINDSSAYWLTTQDELYSMPVTLTEFAQVAVKHAAPRNHWIAGLLPDEIMVDDESWRAPTSWELRHVVGEGSLTGISGAEAAKIVGVTPQNWRKYTAADDAKTRQNISRAAWFKLLKGLEVVR